MSATVASWDRGASVAHVCANYSPCSVSSVSTQRPGPRERRGGACRRPTKGATAMVYQPTRGDGPLRLGPTVRQVPDLGGTTLTADVYRDPERFEQEREKVLSHSWMIAGRSEEIANRGDWLLYEGHGETVVVARQSDGTRPASTTSASTAALGSPAVKSTAQLRRFVCPWHGWVYDTTGKVVGVPVRDDFDPAHLVDLRAPQVRVEEWAGWVWIFLAGPEKAPPLLRLDRPRHRRGPRPVPDGGHVRARQARRRRARPTTRPSSTGSTRCTTPRNCTTSAPTSPRPLAADHVPLLGPELDDVRAASAVARPS